MAEFTNDFFMQGGALNFENSPNSEVTIPACEDTVQNNNEVTISPLKRPHLPGNEDIKKKARLVLNDNGEEKPVTNGPHSSPVAILNKMCQNLDYKVVSQTGPPHCSVFTISVEVNGVNHIGKGSSKKAAKSVAAARALAALQYPLPSALANHDFTKDDDLGGSAAVNGTTKVKTNRDEYSSPINLMLKNVCPVMVPKSPINILYETFPDAVFTCDLTEFGSDACNVRYKTICEVAGQKFEGYGSSKKSAKLGAAKAALAALNIQDKQLANKIENNLPQPSLEARPFVSSALPQTLADQISKLVIDKFNDLMQSDPIHIRRKVLAGIVMTYGPNYQNSEIITVSSGTKCVSGDRLSTCGLAVNDCHAEVISRRCLQVFFYNCLQEIVESPDGEVNDTNPLEPAPGGGYQLREMYRFHLYISTAPCGDARIFSPHEESCLPPDRHPNRQARGQLRTKIESGEGTIPVKSSGGIQTWDGVLLGERLLTMSCSDKVCRWNVLGVQGSLLSNFLRPVYFQSIVLGSLLHPHHLYRAVCGRIIGTLKNLQSPFFLNRPLLAQSSSTEQRNSMRAPTFSVNWIRGQTSAEVINAFTGKTEVGRPSRLCKQNMFKRWVELVPKLSPLPHSSLSTAPNARNNSSQDNIEEMEYDFAKSKAICYQKTKVRLFESFHEANLGKWLKKPIEQDQFHVVEINE